MTALFYLSMVSINVLQNLITDLWSNCIIHPFDNYVIWPGSLALMNREPITLRNLLTRARLQDQKVCASVLYLS
jgi:hypothetical protein